MLELAISKASFLDQTWMSCEVPVTMRKISRLGKVSVDLPN